MTDGEPLTSGISIKEIERLETRVIKEIKRMFSSATGRSGFYYSFAGRSLLR